MYNHRLLYRGIISMVDSMAPSGPLDVARIIYKRYTLQPQFTTLILIIAIFYIVIHSFSFYVNEHNCKMVSGHGVTSCHHQHLVLRSPDALHLTSIIASEASFLVCSIARIFYIIYICMYISGRPYVVP